MTQHWISWGHYTEFGGNEIIETDINDSHHNPKFEPDGIILTTRHEGVDAFYFIDDENVWTIDVPREIFKGPLFFTRPRAIIGPLRDEIISIVNSLL